jgi:predicted CoA-binding protein
MTSVHERLKQLGKEVIPVDLGGEEIDADKDVRKIEDLPASVEAAVLELPKEKTAEIISKVAAIGIRDVWIHQGTDTPEALNAAKTAGVRVVHGNCAVMYVNCTSYHKIHRWIWRLLGKY